MPESVRDPANINVIVLKLEPIGESFEHRLVGVYESRDDVELVEGQLAIYEAKGRTPDDNFSPRFECTEKINVTSSTPEPPKLTSKAVESFV